MIRACSAFVTSVATALLGLSLAGTLRSAEASGLDLSSDPTETTDVAKEHPKRVKELEKLWWAGAENTATCLSPNQLR